LISGYVISGSFFSFLNMRNTKSQRHKPLTMSETR
jgi:hypothetical protein